MKSCMHSVEDDLNQQYEDNVIPMHLPSMGTSDCGTFHVTRIAPPNPEGSEVLLVPGAPWNLNMSKKGAVYLAKAGNRAVTTFEQPLAGKPAKRRPEAVRTVFDMMRDRLQEEEGAPRGVSVIGHSCGGVDAANMADRFLTEGGDPEDIAVLMLLNSAGLRLNGLFGHIGRYRKYVSKVLASGSGAERLLTQQWDQLCREPRRMPQLFRELRYIVNADIVDTVWNIRARGVPVCIVNAPNDTLLGSDAPLGIDPDLQIEGDHSSFFADPLACDGLKILSQLPDWSWEKSIHEGVLPVVRDRGDKSLN